jgi:hypothetical protein
MSRGRGVGWEGTLFLEQIGLPQAGMECGGEGSRVEITGFKITAGKPQSTTNNKSTRMLELPIAS